MEQNVRNGIEWNGRNGIEWNGRNGRQAMEGEQEGMARNGNESKEGTKARREGQMFLISL